MQLLIVLAAAAAASAQYWAPGQWSGAVPYSSPYSAPYSAPYATPYATPYSIYGAGQGWPYSYRPYLTLAAKPEVKSEERVKRETPASTTLIPNKPITYSTGQPIAYPYAAGASIYSGAFPGYSGVHPGYSGAFPGAFPGYSGAFPGYSGAYPGYSGVYPITSRTKRSADQEADDATYALTYATQPFNTGYSALRQPMIYNMHGGHRMASPYTAGYNMLGGMYGHNMYNYMPYRRTIY